MADIELVIKIDEELYKNIYSDAEIMIYGGMRSSKTLLATLLRSVRNGTSLPKGHGRLIDADAYRKELWEEIPNLDYDGSLESYAEGVYSAIMSLNDAQTIIETDKGE